MPGAVRNRWFEAEQVGGVTVLTFSCSEITDQADVDAVGEHLQKLVEYYSFSRLVLNLGSVRRMSSLMLGKLLGLNTRIKAAGGRMVLCHLAPEIYEVFKVVKLLQAFSIYGDEGEALRHV